MSDNKSSFIKISPGAKLKGLRATDNLLFGDVDFIKNEGSLEDALLEGNKQIVGLEETQKTNKYIQDVKNLPVWVQIAFGIFGVLGTFGTLYGAWGTYVMLSQQKSSVVISESIATSTVNVSDIFSRYNEMTRATDQQKFLKNYLDVSIYGLGIFDNISGSFGDDTTYYLHLSVSNSRVSCQFSNVDKVTQRRLDLLKTGDKVSFLGTFTGSTMFGTSRWFIKDCKFVN